MIGKVSKMRSDPFADQPNTEGIAGSLRGYSQLFTVDFQGLGGLATVTVVADEVNP
jgi:hypothetical protein